MFIEIKLLVESPIIVILSVCIKVSCTYFVTPSYTIQLIAILAGDVSNVFIIGMCANCLALRHEPAYERPRFGRLRMREVHPGRHPTTLYHPGIALPAFATAARSDNTFYPPTHFPNWLSVYNGNLSKLFFFSIDWLLFYF